MTEHAATTGPLRFDDVDDPSQVGAFFDVDETLVRGATAFWAAKQMFRRSFFGVRDLVYASAQTGRYVLLGEGGADADALFDRAARAVAGQSLDELQRIGEDLYDAYFVPKVYRATYERLQQHIEAGHQVYLVSATPWLIAEEIARRVGAAGGIGTRVGVEDGKLSGDLVGGIIHGPGKVTAVQKVAREVGIDLERSWAYSDSANDIPLLSLVGHPVPVNPDRALRAHATQMGWPMVRAYEPFDVAKRWAITAAVAGTTAVSGYLLVRSAARRLPRQAKSHPQPAGKR